MTGLARLALGGAAWIGAATMAGVILWTVLFGLVAVADWRIAGLAGTVLGFAPAVAWLGFALYGLGQTRYRRQRASGR